VVNTNRRLILEGRYLGVTLVCNSSLFVAMDIIRTVNKRSSLSNGSGWVQRTNPNLLLSFFTMTDSLSYNHKKVGAKELNFGEHSTNEHNDIGHYS